MLDALLISYLSAWVFTTVGLVVASHWLRSRLRPAPRPVVVSVLAGAVWPVLLLGVVQMGAMAAVSKVGHIANRKLLSINASDPAQNQRARRAARRGQRPSADTNR
jgi:hypothetical protein